MASISPSCIKSSAFRDEQDYSNDEKQKIVIKSLMMLAYARKFHERVKKTRVHCITSRFY